MKREDGYYWVKIGLSELWQIAQWDEEVWWIYGSELWFNDNEIVVVGEKIIKK